MKVDIRYLRIAHLFGRSLIYGQLYADSGEPVLGDLPLPALLQQCYEEDYELTNAQEVLDFVVRQNGFGA